MVIFWLLSIYTTLFLALLRSKSNDDDGGGDEDDIDYDDGSGGKGGGGGRSMSSFGGSVCSCISSTQSCKIFPIGIGSVARQRKILFTTLAHTKQRAAASSVWQRRRCFGRPRPMALANGETAC